MLGRVVLDRYRILRHLADGGMGAIYLARNEGAAGFVRPVVIKWVLPTHSGDSRITDLFMREARIMAQLSHPQIVSVLDFAEEDGMYIMALEYVHGFTLGRWARYVRKSRGAFPVDLAVYVTTKVLAALDYAHNLKDESGTQLHIVHRDVTPSNVLIDIQGNIKLADFGVARIASEKTSVGDNTVKGKFAYLPPESFDRAPASAVTDVYSTAVTLHEVLLGTNEFASDAMAETVGRVLNHTPTRLDKARGDVPKALADVVAKALAKDPAHRYQSASEFARALSAALPQTDAVTGEKLKSLVAVDFLDEKLAEMAQMPSLTELESAWRTPAALPLPRRTTSQRAIAAPGEATVALPGTRGAAAQAPSSSKKLWITIAVILGLAALGAIAFVAISAFMATQEQAKNDQPAFVVVDKRTDVPDAAPSVTAPPADAAEAAAAVDAAPAPVDAGRKPVIQTPPPVPDSRQLTKAFGRYTGAVTACFKQHVEAAGLDVAIRFQIDQTGKVLNAEVLPEALADKPVGKCLVRVARGAQFGRQAKPVTFRVPIQTKAQ
jgi:serine/threonine-protein kinase